MKREETRRVELNFDCVQEDIDEILTELRALGKEEQFQQILGQGAVQRLARAEHTIRKRMQDAFQLAVVGDFKRGKSTLINALLGVPAVPTAVTPETATINRLSYGEVPRIRAVLKNGTQVELKREELKREELEKILCALPAEIDYVEIQENAGLLQAMSIVDTPGVGEMLQRFQVQVAKALVQADAILYVVSARSPLSLSEQQFLSTCVLPQSFSRLLVVINMSDCLETAENIHRVKALVRERVRAICPNSSVFAVSALDEFCRSQGLERPEPELAELLENGFQELQAAIKSDMIIQKDLIQCSRSIVLTQALLAELETRVRLAKSAYQADAEQITASEAEFERQNAALLEGAQRRKAALSTEIMARKGETRQWMTAFMARLKETIAKFPDETDTGDLERYFQFYLGDLVKEAILACVSRHQKEIADRLETVSQSFAGEISSGVFGGIHAQIADCITDISWTGVDAALFVVNTVSSQAPVLAELMLVGQVVAGFFRQKVMKARQKDILGPVLEGFDGITADVLEKVGNIYNQLRQEAVDQLERFSQQQIELLREAIEQAGQAAAGQAICSKDVFQYLAAITARLELCSLRLRRYE